MPVTDDSARSTSLRTTESGPAPGVLAPFVWLPVLGIAGVVAVVLLIGAGMDGYFFDELYFIAAGTKYPSWGYADQGPFLPFLASVLHALAPGSPTVLRIPMMVVTVAEVLVAAAMARELGGGKRAQVMAAAATAMSMHLMSQNHSLSTYGIDPLWWMVICWLLIRWIRISEPGNGRADWLLLAAGATTSVSMQTKVLVPLLWICVIAGVLISGPRRLLTRPLLWCGAALAIATSIPEFVWQVENGWPQLEMVATISAETGLEGRLLSIPMEIMFAGVVTGAFLCCYGIRQLLRAPELRPYRFFGWAIVIIVVVVVISGARPYYIAGLYALAFAAGAVVFERRRAKTGTRRRHWLISPVAYVLSAVLAVYSFFTTSVTGAFLPPPANADLVTVAHDAARSFGSLPVDRRQHTTLVAKTYREAAALDVYGPALGLPGAFSPHRGYWYFGKPSETADDMLYVGADADRFRPYFGSALLVDPGAPEPIWLFTARAASWERIWAEQQSFA